MRRIPISACSSMINAETATAHDAALNSGIIESIIDPEYWPCPYQWLVPAQCPPDQMQAVIAQTPPIAPHGKVICRRRVRLRTCFIIGAYHLSVTNVDMNAILPESCTRLTRPSDSLARTARRSSPYLSRPLIENYVGSWRAVRARHRSWTGIARAPLMIAELGHRDTATCVQSCGWAIAAPLSDFTSMLLA